MKKISFAARRKIVVESRKTDLQQKTKRLKKATGWKMRQPLLDFRLQNTATLNQMKSDFSLYRKSILAELSNARKEKNERLAQRLRDELFKVNSALKGIQRTLLAAEKEALKKSGRSGKRQLVPV